MILEGAVTNVAAFGAFVDIGVHQDGLVHISAMSKTFVKDPRSIAKPGDIVRVKVMEVDVARKRIALSMRLDDEAAPRAASGQERGGAKAREASTPPRARQSTDKAPASDGAFGAALAAAMRASKDKAR
jgi:uncharacterized protein